MVLRRPDRRSRPAPIYLHIGGPSTGTTYLQRLMYANRDGLGRTGYLLPAPWRDVVLATHDALSFGRPTGHKNDLTRAAGGRWDRLAEELTAHGGKGTVVSMEFLCWARPAAAERIISSLGDAEVHVVLTVRDTAAVLRSQWQTNCRNGEEVPLRRMLWGLRQIVKEDGEPASRPERMIHRGMGIPTMIDTWVPLVGADRVHVVTVPLRSDDPDLLWKRFAGVVGIKPSRCRERAVQSNASLGLPSSELMRLLNIELGPVRRTDYLRTMKVLLARDILSERADQERKVTLNRPGRNLAARWNDRIRGAISTSGVDLVGSLDDLPVTRAGKDVPAELETPTDEELLFAAAWARKGLVEAIGDLEDRIAKLREDQAYVGSAPAVGPGAEDSDQQDDDDAADDGPDDGPDDDRADDDPDDVGLDPRARLDRQLRDRTPEVGLALTEIAGLVRQAMPLGAELAELRAAGTSPAPSRDH
ncbi:hypothetical protein [Nocardioides bizhenqiangii]|uniref:Sulfotransferase family protein n=1 Tax=Nocardioides bizhenqiangii TaxID=3095076 RepID=A0ABZ0ZNE3_9ACTN|nr:MULTISPECIES: hypothetical protein [unclassified Nocardioides]MDZ5621220.1 hypothetical protein [Nocardioides sp. HM23]WQQ25476.1 hypothetical protein SHK19_16095 [Nocardioides sp. HM61]